MFASNIALSLSHNSHYRLPKGQMRTFRGYIKPTVHGTFPWRFTYSNTVDSTWDDGSFSRADMPGSAFRILHAAVCACDAQQNIMETHPVTWQGAAQKDALPREVFTCDPAVLSIPHAGYVMFEWCIQPTDDLCILPGTPDSRGLCYIAETDAGPVAPLSAFRPMNEETEEPCVLPDLWEADRPIAARMAFLGDSITQGCQTRINAYEQWAARIAWGMPADVSVLNAGLGFARAQDAARNGAWMQKLAGMDVVNLCLGINDIFQMTEAEDHADVLTRNLQTAVQLLKAQGAKVVLFTLPPFSLEGHDEQVRSVVNRRIRDTRLGADAVFDMEILAVPGTQGQARFGDHPDGVGGAAVAGEYLSHFLHAGRHLLLK